MFSTRRVLSAFVSIGLLAPSLAAPVAPNTLLAASDLLQNGKDAQQLNSQFATATASDSCTNNAQGCVNGQFAQCTGGKWSLTACSGGTQCAALPLVNSKGTSVTCDTQADAVARIAATGATGG
ncbi:hypothetical protein DFH11DRAFT_1484524, partial [Phellopilus nigrolimitatus]